MIQEPIRATVARLPHRQAGLTPGAYIRRRREASMLGLADAAQLLASSAEEADATEMMLAEAEADQRLLPDAVLDRLGRVFSYDRGVYDALVLDLPVPSICDTCGCSWNDACLDPITGTGCAWADHTETRCTACAEPRS